MSGSCSGLGRSTTWRLRGQDMDSKMCRLSHNSRNWPVKAT
jgi:hypothetical protein